MNIIIAYSVIYKQMSDRIPWGVNCRYVFNSEGLCIPDIFISDSPRKSSTSDKHYYIRYDQYHDSAMLRKQRSIYQRHSSSDQPVMLSRYGKNWKLLEEGMKITWPGIEDDVLYYLKYDQDIANIIIRLGLVNVTANLPLNTDIEITDRLRSEGVNINFYIDGPTRTLKDAHNSLHNGDHPLTLCVNNHILLMELLEWRSIPYVATYMAPAYMMNSLHLSTKIYQFGSHDDKMRLLELQVRDNQIGFIQVGLISYITHEEMMEVINILVRNSTKVSVNMIVTIIRYLEADDQVKRVALAKLSGLCDQLDSSSWECPNDQPIGDRIQKNYIPATPHNQECYRLLTNADSGLKECTHDDYRNYSRSRLKPQAIGQESK